MTEYDDVRGCVVIVVLACVGCAGLRPARGPGVLPSPTPANTSTYRIGCSDVLEVRFTPPSPADSVVVVDVDGRIALGTAGPVFVDGLTPTAAAAAVARATNRPVQGVMVRVLEARAARVYVSGPDNHTTRVLPYTGPVSVLDFLASVGAIVPNTSNLNDITVVRPNVATDRPADVFVVDVRAALHGDATTNVVIRPADHIYVGETRRASFARLLPPWLQPWYRNLVGLWIE